jgi:hypothetical protein
LKRYRMTSILNLKSAKLQHLTTMQVRKGNIYICRMGKLLVIFVLMLNSLPAKVPRQLGFPSRGSPP